MFAQDLLMYICVNCARGEQADKDLIVQIVKLKPKPKQILHYYDCIRLVILRLTITQLNSNDLVINLCLSQGS